jgi:hypothetical protein
MIAATKPYDAFVRRPTTTHTHAQPRAMPRSDGIRRPIALSPNTASEPRVMT